MSEITVTADALKDEPPTPARQLRGNLWPPANGYF
jgi:hypothetical protein